MFPAFLMSAHSLKTKAFYLNFSFIFLLLFPPKDYTSCNILELAFKTLLENEHKTIYIANTYETFEENTIHFYVSLFKDKLNPKQLQKAIQNFKLQKTGVKLNCFRNMLLGNKDSLLEMLHNNRGIVLPDSPFIKFIEERHADISKISNEEKRIVEENKLTLTVEFQKFNKLQHYLTPRLIVFTQPNFVDNYCIVRFDVLKDYTDARYGFLCLFKKKGDGWILIKIENT
jgi:hypothetical protein